MNKQLCRIAIGSFLLLTTGIANASLMTWHDEYDTVRYMDTYHETDSWTFDINDNGFNSNTDWVSSYKINLYLHDDRYDPWYAPYEFVYFNQDGLYGDAWFEVDTGIYGIGGSLSGLISLNEDGTVSATLKRLSGDFYFYGADLWAYGERHDVPEPGMLSLLALGLLGLGIFTRRFRATA